MPLLPPEIVGLIVDNLKDKETLKHSSLVSREWRLLSQKNLFSSFDLRLSHENISKVDNHLRASPHLQSMIRTLSITLTYEFYTLSESMSGYADVLNKFTNIAALNIIGEDYHFGRKDCSSWGTWSNRHLKHPLTLPSLRTVYLCHVEVQVGEVDAAFFNLLVQSPALKTIELIGLSILESDGRLSPLSPPDNAFLDAPDRFPADIPKIRVSNLNVLSGIRKPTKAHLQWLLQSIDFRGITGLHISYGESYLHEIVAHTECLESLILTSKVPDNSHDPVDLSRTFKALLSITFKFHTPRSSFVPDLLTWIERTLATLPPSNIVARIQFAIVHEGRLLSETQSWIRIWNDLASSLAVDRLPHLKSVKISTFGLPGGIFLLAGKLAIDAKEGLGNFFGVDGPPFIIEVQSSSISGSL